MILVDSSAWIDYFRDTRSPVANHVDLLIKNRDEICICGIILTEVLQGVRSEKQKSLVENCFNSLTFLPTTRESYVFAAEIYRKARSNGDVIRSTIDCLIAACAISYKASLLHCDKDYDVISKYSSLKVVRV